MAGLKDQRREHPGIRAPEPPEPPGVPQFSRGETPASNSFGTPKPGDGVQMAPPRRPGQQGGPTWPPRPDAGPLGRGRGLAPPVRGLLLRTGRQAHTALPPRAPPGHQPYVQRDNGRQLVPEAPGRGVGSRGVGGGDGTGGRSELASLSRQPLHRPGPPPTGTQGPGCSSPHSASGNGQRRGRRPGPPAQGAACSPQRERSRWPSRGRRAERRLLGGWCAREQRWGRKPTGSHWRMEGWGQGGQSGLAARLLPAPGSAGCPSFPEEGAGSQSRHGAPAFGAPLSTRWCVLAVSWWRGGREAPEGRERELGEPLCREQSQRAS